MRKSLAILLALCVVTSFASAVGADQAGLNPSSQINGQSLRQINGGSDMDLLGSELHLWQFQRCVDVVGNYAYVVGGYPGLFIVDISNADSIYQVGVYDSPGNVTWVDVQGDYAYVADYSGGLRIVDVSDPTNPTEVGSYTSTTNAVCVAVDGDYAFVADDYFQGFYIIDISDPTSLSMKQFFKTPGFCDLVFYESGYLFVSDGSFVGVNVYDVSNINEIEKACNLHPTGSPSGIAVSGDYAYVASGMAGLEIFDISDITSPVYAGQYPVTDLGTYTVDVDVVGDKAYLAVQSRGFSVIDVSDPSEPTLIAKLDTTASTEAVFALQDSAYVLALDQNFGLCEISVETPESPEVTSSYVKDGVAKDVAIGNGYAYVALEEAGISVIDLADTNNPVEVNRFKPEGGVVKVTYHNGYLFAALRFQGVLIYDLTDPTIEGLTPYSSYNATMSANSVYIDGNYAYLANSGGGFVILDISDLSAPEKVGGVSSGTSYDLVVKGDYLYIADLNNGLQVYSVANPASPQRIGFLNVYGDCFAIDVNDQYAYLVGTSGMFIIDITNPRSPTLVKNHFTGYQPMDIQVKGNLAFQAALVGGARVIDIGNPDEPGLLGYFNSPGINYGIEVDDDYKVYLADAYYFHVLQYTGGMGTSVEEPSQNLPTRYEIASLYPNPFNPTLNMVISLPERSPLTVEIHNSLGQRVATLAEGKFEAGSHTLTFDGSGLSSGVYFVHAFSQDRFNAVKKVVLMK